MNVGKLNRKKSFHTLATAYAQACEQRRIKEVKRLARRLNSMMLRFAL